MTAKVIITSATEQESELGFPVTAPSSQTGGPYLRNRCKTLDWDSILDVSR
jgi:hypothetical protein